MKRNLIVVLIVALASDLFAQNECTGPNPLINNGSFNGTVGTNVTAPGWIGTLSPDLNDDINGLHTTSCYYWIGTPLPSVDGGTWQNIFGVETIEQNCSLLAGQNYQLCFEYAAQGIECPPAYIFNGPIGVAVYIDNTFIFSTPNDTTQYTWEYACTSFTATSSSVNIRFGTTSNNYVAIDGVCLTPLTGIAENGAVQIRVFPNPFRDQLQITNENNLPLYFQLTDIRSGLLMDTPLNSTEIISTKSLASGMYFYAVSGPDGIIKTGKLIKE